MSDTEYDIEQNKVRTLWHRVMFRGSELQVTVAAGGVGKILDFGITTEFRCAEGFSPTALNSVLKAYGEQLDQTSAAVDQYMSKTSDEELDAWEPPEGWIPYTDEDIENMESTKCEVVYLEMCRRGG